MFRNLVVLGVLVLFVAIGLTKADFNIFKAGPLQIDHRIDELSNSVFASISRLSDKAHLRNSVRNILKPRVVGSPGHEQVRKYIVHSLRGLNWTVDIDSFYDTAPILGKLHFHNIIAKHNPKAERYLMLACHYDSKYFKDFDFLGATDSAVPCAMLLNLAYVLQHELKPYKNSKLGLMLIFFDGEEAFEKWGPTDSIYGSRHLAKKWEGGFINRLDVMMLLDLIGAPNPKFYNMFSNTASLYQRLMAFEDRLLNAGSLEHHSDRYFQPNSSTQVSDDHLPFLERNVPILHLIPTPFPSVWHTKDDSEKVINYETTENIARIVRVFVMEYMGSSKSLA